MLLALSSSTLGFAPVQPSLLHAPAPAAQVRMQAGPVGDSPTPPPAAPPKPAPKKGFAPFGAPKAGKKTAKQMRFPAPKNTDGGMTFTGLKDLAASQNPVIGYWDPLNFASESLFQDYDNTASIGWLRQAEIKHGRVAMAGFIGFIISELGIRWPFPLSLKDFSYSSYDGLGAPEVWDALPDAAKYQIVGAIGLFELWDETSTVERSGKAHYMKGGKPGAFAPFRAKKGNGPTAQFLPNLYDPLNLSKNRSAEDKAAGLNAEVNNGRLAMIGLMAFVSEAKVPGSVPGLSGLIKPYAGNIMRPFTNTLWEGGWAVTPAVKTAIAETGAAVYDTITP